MGERLNREMIVLARESRGINQTWMSTKLGLSQGYLNKVENLDLGVKPELIEGLAEATRYPSSFFFQEGQIVPDNQNYRKREKVAQKLVTPVHARTNILRLHVQIIGKEVKIPNLAVPFLSVSEQQTPQAVAKTVRKVWKLNPVVDNLSLVMEQHGVITYRLDFKTDRIDSRFILTEDKQPIIVINSSAKGDRQRFSLAYQLGHLVMHTFGSVPLDADVSHEANLFAAEFLMPEDFIRQDFESGITIKLLGELKRKWKVSMISLLYRACDLGYVTANQKKYVLQQFNELKIRRAEPVELDIPEEKPQLMRSLISEAKEKLKLNAAGMASKLHLTQQEFIELYN